MGVTLVWLHRRLSPLPAFMWLHRSSNHQHHLGVRLLLPHPYKPPVHPLFALQRYLHRSSPITEIFKPELAALVAPPAPGPPIESHSTRVKGAGIDLFESERRSEPGGLRGLFRAPESQLPTTIRTPAGESAVDVDHAPVSVAHRDRVPLRRVRSRFHGRTACNSKASRDPLAKQAGVDSAKPNN